MGPYSTFDGIVPDIPVGEVQGRKRSLDDKGICTYLDTAKYFCGPVVILGRCL